MRYIQMPFQDGDKFLMYVVDKMSVESVENMVVKYLGVKHPEIQRYQQVRSLGQ